MALIKEKIFPNGISGNYWKVTGLTLDLLTDQGSIRLDLYKDSEAEAPLKLPGSTKNFKFQIDHVNVMNNTLAAAYPKIKAYANSVIRPAVEATEAVELVRDEDGNIVTYAQPARPARPAVYGDADLKDAVDG